MKVYIVIREIPFESDDIDSIHSTRERAEAKVKYLMELEKSLGYLIYEYELDEFYEENESTESAKAQGRGK